MFCDIRFLLCGAFYIILNTKFIQEKSVFKLCEMSGKAETSERLLLETFSLFQTGIKHE